MASSKSTHKPVHGHATTKFRQPQNTCFGCGVDNPDGMQLRFYYDEAKKHALCDFNLGKKFQGPPGHVHGGIIATILDEAMGKVNKLRNVVALTKKMEVIYQQPVPLHQDLRAIGWEKHVEGRKHTNVAEIRNSSGDVLARSEGLFIAIDVEKMFAKFAAEGKLPDELRQQMAAKFTNQQLGASAPVKPSRPRKSPRKP